MQKAIQRALQSGYTSEVDTLSENQWYHVLEQFDDANIYQTWAYVAVTSGRRNMSHLVLRKNGEIVAIALLRIAKLPLIKAGIAYLRWGPVWRRRGHNIDPETFRNVLRALRNEYRDRRALTVRIFPMIFDNDNPLVSGILCDEGFSTVGNEAQPRTILMCLAPSLADLRDGMKPHWKRQLKVAERKQLQIIEGEDHGTFDIFIRIYREMVSRKQFSEPNDILQFRAVQGQLPSKFKMKVTLCHSNGDICAGLICSAIGDTAIYLFGATSNAGMTSNGSYLLQWHLLGELKQLGTKVYNLHGINPVKNPGTYRFKSDLAGANGRDIYFLGRFDCQSGFLSRICLGLAEALRTRYRNMKAWARGCRRPSLADGVPRPIQAGSPDHA